MFVLGIIQDQGVITPVSCAVTLTGDHAAEFGGVPADISGQTASVTNAPDTGDRIASTDLNNPTPMWSGLRIVEASSLSVSAGDGLLHLLILAADKSKAADIKINSVINAVNSGITASTHQPAGTVVSDSGDSYRNVQLSEITKMSVGVNGTTGDVRLFFDIGGVLVECIGPQIDTGYLGFFSSVTSAGLGLVLQPTLGADGSITVVTDASTYASGYPAGTRDWCGTAVENTDSVSDPGEMSALIEIPTTRDIAIVGTQMTVAPAAGTATVCRNPCFPISTAGITDATLVELDVTQVPSVGGYTVGMHLSAWYERTDYPRLVFDSAVGYWQVTNALATDFTTATDPTVAVAFYITSTGSVGVWIDGVDKGILTNGTNAFADRRLNIFPQYVNGAGNTGDIVATLNSTSGYRHAAAYSAAAHANWARGAIT